MAIAPMSKIIIVSHRQEASKFLEALQREGICHVLNAEEAAVTRDFPDLGPAAERPKDIEALLNRLQKGIAFLKNYAKAGKGLAGVLAPRTVIDEQSYKRTVSDREILKVVDACEQLEGSMEKIRGRIENLRGTLEMLGPWSTLETPVEEISAFSRTACWAGLMPGRQLEQTQEQLAALGAAIQQIGAAAGRSACLVVCLKENAEQAQKFLWSAEFEPVSFEPMTGTVAGLIREHGQKLNQAEKQLQDGAGEAAALSRSLLQLEVLYDHCQNLRSREQTKDAAPATEHAVLLEGWVRKRDFSRLRELVSHFEASSVTEIEPAEDEQAPVEIENGRVFRPFEAITRLYGMPVPLGIDPTACLAPFFVVFFALCLADVGYGLAIAALMIWLLVRWQGDKKLLWLFLTCAGLTIPLGVITGGWFGDAVPKFIPALNPLREKLMLFDPLEQPMVLFALSIILGYVQIMTGLLIAFAHNIRQKDYIAALCDQLTWLVMLNFIALFGLSKSGMIPARAGKPFGALALIPAAMIFLFSHRQGRWAGRLGMGAYNLFSAVFYLGDVLSYLRLMALCMVGGGIAMSINIIAGICMDIPYGLGILTMVLVFVFGHALNLVLSALGAFVHTLRLQYVEFFTKFFVGGGRPFQPLCREYKHIYIRT